MTRSIDQPISKTGELTPWSRSIVGGFAVAALILASFWYVQSFYRKFLFAWDGWTYAVIVLPTFVVMFLTTTMAIRTHRRFSLIMAVMAFLVIVHWQGPIFYRGAFNSVSVWEERTIGGYCSFQFPVGDERVPFGKEIRPLASSEYVNLRDRISNHRFYELYILATNSSAKAQESLDQRTLNWRPMESMGRDAVVRQTSFDGLPAKTIDVHYEFEVLPEVPRARYRRSLGVANQKMVALLTVWSAYPLDGDREVEYFFQSLKIVK